MSENSRTRASITSTMAEIVHGHQALGLRIEEEDFDEAWAILDRIEKRMIEAKAKAWAERWP